MGQIEEQIKQEVLKEVFSDTTNIYEFIENRYSLDELQRDKLISKLNTLNNDLTILLKEAKLS